MPATKQHRALARRRHPAHAGCGADVSMRSDRVDDLIRVATDPSPWAARRQGDDRMFRGRLRPGTAVLPARPTSPDRVKVTFGVASRPIVLRSVGVAHQVPAHTPWAIQTDMEWRITVTEPTDLRVVHACDLPPGLVGATVVAARPTRFRGREAQIVRAALRSVTPAWVDASANQVPDLAVAPQRTWRQVSARATGGAGEPDAADASVLMLTWALEQRGGVEEPRHAAVTQFIRARISDPGLSTHGIAEQLQISRRSLQAMFENEGGVAAFIRRQRLAAALRVMAQDPEGSPDLDALAEATGFGSRRTLERAMRQVYGLTPRQARAKVRAGQLLRERHLNEVVAS